MATLTLRILPPLRDEEIRMDQTPTQPRWALIPLYKSSVAGDMLLWQISFDGVRNLKISQGCEDGIIQTDKIEVSLDNTGRSMQDQALQEARRRYKLKYREGYQPAGAMTPPLVKAMKGHEYKPNSIKRWPVYTQPKLNGIRMLCQDMGLGPSDNGEIRPRLAMRSWLNNAYTHLTHIETELWDFFPYLPRYCTLDGELYNHNMDFSTLTSAVKTVKTIHPRLQDVQYWIFDINYEDPEGAPFEKRCALLINAFQRYIQDRSPTSRSDDVSVLPRTFAIVPTQVARTHAEVLHQHSQHVAAGYEGIMIKKITNGAAAGSKEYKESLYRPGKGNNILKYKDFTDEEATIVGVIEGPEEGVAIFNVQDRTGNVFPVKMRGDLEQRRYWFQNQHLVIGKEITIRYQKSQELLAHGGRLYPIGIAIRDYE